MVARPRGGDRNRTGVRGFAGPCLTTRPPRRSTRPNRAAGPVYGTSVTGPDGETIVYTAEWDGRPQDTYVTRIHGTDSRPIGIPRGRVLAVSRTGELAVQFRKETGLALGRVSVPRVQIGQAKRRLHGKHEHDRREHRNDEPTRVSQPSDQPIRQHIESPHPERTIAFRLVSPRDSD